MKIGDAKKKALDILGKEAKMPKLPGDLVKDAAAFEKAMADLVDARNLFENKLLAAKKAASAYLDTCESNKDVVEGTDFSLDAKKADNKAKISKATSLICEALDESGEIASKTRTVCESTLKQVASMAKAFDAL